MEREVKDWEERNMHSLESQEEIELAEERRRQELGHVHSILQM